MNVSQHTESTSSDDASGYSPYCSHPGLFCGRGWGLRGHKKVRRALALHKANVITDKFTYKCSHDAVGIKKCLARKLSWSPSPGRLARPNPWSLPTAQLLVGVIPHQQHALQACLTSPCTLRATSSASDISDGRNSRHNSTALMHCTYYTCQQLHMLDPSVLGWHADERLSSSCLRAAAPACWVKNVSYKEFWTLGRNQELFTQPLYKVEVIL